MSRHRMAPADAAWLRMDRPTNLMIVNSVMWFEEPIDPTALREVLGERLVSKFPRFRQRVVDDHGIWWEDFDGFDLEAHLHDVTLPAPAGRAELQDYVARMLPVPLDPDRPLWDIYVVTPYDGGGTALFFRMHHAIADGIALTRVLLSLTDDPDQEPADLAEPTEHHGPSIRGAIEGVFHEAWSLASHPMRLPDLASTVVADAAAAAKLTLLPPDRHTALRGKTTTHKAVIWSEPIPLQRVKDAGHHAGATVNDVLLAGVAGALRTNLVHRRSPVHDVRAIVPFNLRPLDKPLPADLGNKFGLVYLSLPVSHARREDRLHEMSRRMTAIKDSAEGLVAYGILELIGLAPAGVENLAIDIFASKATGVMTNVPGPRHQVTFAGVPLAGTIGWVPSSGDLGLGVAIFSYAGSITIGLCVDTALVPDVHALLAEVENEIEAILVSHALAHH